MIASKKLFGKKIHRIRNEGIERNKSQLKHGKLLGDFLRFLRSTVSVGSGAARFFLAKHTKGPCNIPNDRKIYQMAVNIPNSHKIYQYVPCRGPPKFTQIGIFGMKIYHLATLVGGRVGQLTHYPNSIKASKGAKRAFVR
jgi:hypothetical protein